MQSVSFPLGRGLCLLVGAASLLITPILLPAAESVRYSALPGSKLRMDGDSSVHKWSAETPYIGGTMELDATFPEAASTTPSTITPKVDVKIPVRSLKTSGGKRMDAVMQEHMKATQFKTIDYRVLELTPKKGGTAGQFDAKGTLTVAGVTKTNTMTVNIERVDKTKLKVTGTTGLKMTEFGISPPAPEIGLGLIKTYDDVALKFEWLTEQKAPVAAP